MVDGKSESNSEPESTFMGMGNKELLEFYQNKFDELQRKDDKYKEKVDKHLKDLIADRYELEAEVYRKGEKISDLQKALVELQLSCFEEREKFLNVSAENERLKKNEEILHDNIRQLLNLTKDKDLRDRIIYILHNPEVEIGFRETHPRSAGTSTLTKKRSAEDFLLEQVKELQSKIDEFSKISKNSSGVLLEDCKITLETSLEKIKRQNEEIQKLQKRLQETEAQVLNLKQSSSNRQEEIETRKCKSESNMNYKKHESKSAESLKNTRSAPAVHFSKSTDTLHKNVEHTHENISSNLKDLHFSLMSLSKISSKISCLLKSIKSSEAFIQLANLSNSVATCEHAKEDDILQLQNCIRQCTRLSYDVNNIWRTTHSLLQTVGLSKLNVEWEISQLESCIEEIAVATADTELLSLSLTRTAFFDLLTKPKESFTKFGSNDSYKHSRLISNIRKVEENIVSSSDFITSALKFIERITEKVNDRYKADIIEHSNAFSYAPHDNQSQTKIFDGHDRFKKSSSAIDDERNMLKSLEKGRSEMNKPYDIRRTQSEPITGDITRKIGTTLAKIEQIERGVHFKDFEIGRYLEKQISDLSKQLTSLYNDFNMKSLQNNFSEYTSVTLSKLETLAKQSRDTVLSAEAQISAYRSNVQSLSLKLRDTEELLRESISECLSLKKKLKQAELGREKDKAKLGEDLEERLQRVSDFDDLETAVKEVASSVTSSRVPRKPGGPYECMFCKQGTDHKLCEEKIREMRANIRKLSTELKLLNQEMKEEKKKAKLSQEQAEKIVLDSINQRDGVKDTIQSLEARNASLIEQLKVAKNRLKNMERYRHSEIEGFQTDIKNLKMKIQESEKQLSKAMLVFEHSKKDEELLKEVHATALRSKTAVAAIRRLKAKLYEIERDIKHL